MVTRLACSAQSLVRRLVGPDIVKPSSIATYCSTRSGVAPDVKASKPDEDLHAQLEPLDGQHEGVFLLTLNRPSAKNAIGKQMLRELRECLGHLASESTSTRCVVVRSATLGVFCSGVDLNERECMTRREKDEFNRELGDAINTLEGLAIPTVAAISGYALGSGAELALACDLRVGGPDAKFAFPEARLGMIPSCGGTQRLARLVGRSRAKHMLYTGRGINSAESSEIGLLDVMVENDDPIVEALEVARDICASAPMAVQAIKMAINLGSETELSTGLKIEQACYDSVKSSKDCAEGLAAFAEKRNPNFKGE